MGVVFPPVHFLPQALSLDQCCPHFHFDYLSHKMYNYQSNFHLLYNAAVFCSNEQHALFRPHVLSPS